MPAKKSARKVAAKAETKSPAKASKAPKPAADVPSVKKAAKPVAKKAGRAAASPKAVAERLTLADVMRTLESGGSEATRRTYARHGAQGPMYGVKFGDLFRLMKRIDVDHALARELWATGNVDARNLAMKIADPAVMTPDELDQWAVENPMPICGLYIATLAAEGPHARTKLREWLGSSDGRVLATGWTLLGRLSDLDETFPEDDLLRRVGDIESSIHTVPDEVREEMHRTLIRIGGRSPALRKAVLAAAKRIGKVTIDHGDTRCTTADVAEAVGKLWERSGTKFPSPAAHERALGSMRRRC